MHEFRFYEDDVGQIEVKPIANWNYCVRELAALAEHDEEYRAPDGIGWTQMYRFSDDAESLKDTVALRSLGITEARFIELLSPHGKRFDRLISPLSEIDAELGIRSVGFGPSRSTGIVADLDGDIVASIWCRLAGTTDEDEAMLAAMLTALSRDHHLLLVDWAATELIDLRETEVVETYLRGE
jgi:hypothetical protein